MATYHIYRGAKLPTCLARYDNVVFYLKGRVYPHTVASTYLSYDFGVNRTVFSVLELPAREFCTRHYGYRATSDAWPECRENDMAALTRVVHALAEHCSTKVHISRAAYRAACRDAREAARETKRRAAEAKRVQAELAKRAREISQWEAQVPRSAMRVARVFRNDASMFGCQRGHVRAICEALIGCRIPPEMTRP